LLIEETEEGCPLGMWVVAYYQELEGEGCPLGIRMAYYEEIEEELHKYPLLYRFSLT